MRTRYYLCSGHHRGGKAACPKRYQVPAGPVEHQILETIKSDLVRLRHDDKLHELIADQLATLGGAEAQVRVHLRQRLAELDSQSAKLRGHLLAPDARTAESMGLYEQARKWAGERERVEAELARADAVLPELPSEHAIRRSAEAAFDTLDKVLAGGTLEEMRELISLYVHRLEAHPARHSVRISYYPLLFPGHLSRKIGATRLV